MHWRLILEEYGPELVYTPGHTNIVADALSHLEIAAIQPTFNLNLTFSALQLTNAELLGHDATDALADVYPLYPTNCLLPCRLRIKSFNRLFYVPRIARTHCTHFVEMESPTILSHTIIK
jgi:hypothetical protein